MTQAIEPELPAGRPRAVLDAVPVPIAVLDLTGTIATCNAAFAALFGSDRDALTGTALEHRVSKKDRDDVRGQLSKLVMGTMPAAHLEEVRIVGASGSGRSVALHAAMLADDVGGVAVTLLDSAGRPAIDVELMQAQKMQALGQLAGGIAHDFNNLLTAIIGFSDLLLDRHGPDEAAHADIAELRHNALRGSRLVRQLLTFSRRQPRQTTDLAVNEALGALKSLLDRLLGETVELRLELSASRDVVRIDPGHFDQMMINLAVNARDAMPGGGELTVRTAAGSAGDSTVCIEVADTGIGIAKEILGNVFEPFFTTKEPGTGTGLGLSTVYGIVRQADGEVGIDSAPGEGTTVTIRLPAVAQADVDVTETPVPDAAVPKTASRTATVLLVEDEDAVRQFAARALASKGHAVLQADSGEAALDVIGERPDTVDLLVSDVVMPGMDGYTLSRLVRAEVPHLAVILMSGYADEALAPGLASDPSVHFLAKPFTLAQLTAMVDSLLTT